MLAESGQHCSVFSPASDLSVVLLAATGATFVIHAGTSRSPVSAMVILVIVILYAPAIAVTVEMVRAPRRYQAERPEFRFRRPWRVFYLFRCKIRGNGYANENGHVGMAASVCYGVSMPAYVRPCDHRSVTTRAAGKGDKPAAVCERCAPPASDSRHRGAPAADIGEHDVNGLPRSASRRLCGGCQAEGGPTSFALSSGPYPAPTVLYQARHRFYYRLAGLAFALALAPFLAIALYDAQGPSSVQVAIGWVLMVVSIGLLVVVLGDQATASLGFLAVAILCVYHGMSGALFAIFPGGERYRAVAGVSESAAAGATLYAGVGIFALTVAYLLTVRRRSAIVPTPATALELEIQFRRVSCRALLIWTFVALLYLSGINTILAGAARLEYWAGALTKYMILPLVVMTTLRMIVAVRAGEMRRRSAVALGFTMALAIIFLITRRQDLLVATAATLVLAAKWRLGRPSRSAALIGGIAMIFLFVALASLRQAVGRYSLTHTSLIERVPLVVNGLLSSTADGAGLHRAASDAGYRLDGNTFFGGMVQARSREAEAMDLTPFRIVATLMIPSSIWSAKLDLDVTARSPGAYFVVTRHMGEADYLITPLALFYAMGGVPFMTFIMATVGVLLGWLDRLVVRRISLVTIVAAVCTAVALGQAEQDLSAWGLALRAGALLLPALSLLALRFRRAGFGQRRYT